MSAPRHLPCHRCGASLERAARATHECVTERLVELWMFELREEVAGLEERVRAHLASPLGRFECRWAAQHVRGLT